MLLEEALFLIGRRGPTSRSLLWLSQIWDQLMKACWSQFCPLEDVECCLLGWMTEEWVAQKCMMGDES